MPGRTPACSPAPAADSGFTAASWSASGPSGGWSAGPRTGRATAWTARCMRLHLLRTSSVREEAVLRHRVPAAAPPKLPRCSARALATVSSAVLILALRWSPAAASSAAVCTAGTRQSSTTLRPSAVSPEPVLHGSSAAGPVLGPREDDAGRPSGGRSRARAAPSYNAPGPGPAGSPGQDGPVPFSAVPSRSRT